MRRALPIAGCGMSPSPAISFEVSTTTTRLENSEASTRAASRSMVVFPTPGRPMIRIDFPDSMWSRRISIVPKTERPTRQVRPTTRSARFLIAEMRCSVRSIPARLSPPKSPMREITHERSSSVTSRSNSVTSPEVSRASGRRPRSMTTSRSPSRPAASSSRVESSRMLATISPGRQSRRRSRLSTIASSCTTVGASMGLVPSCGVLARLIGRILARRPAERNGLSDRGNHPWGSHPRPGVTHGEAEIGDLLKAVCA